MTFIPDLRADDSGKKWTQSEAIDAALREHFQISLSDLEDRFLQALRAEPVTEELRQDVRLSIRQYNAIRRYQQLMDPSAYFLTAWLPDGKSMRQKDITADFMRHPSALPNVVIETMLVSADAYLRAGDYPEAQRHLESIESSLASFEAGEAFPFAADALAKDYWSVASLLEADGYHAQRIEFNQNTAQAWGSPMGSAAKGLYPVELSLVRSGDGWVLASKAQLRDTLEQSAERRCAIQVQVVKDKSPRDENAQYDNQAAAASQDHRAVAPPFLGQRLVVRLGWTRRHLSGVARLR